MGASSVGSQKMGLKEGSWASGTAEQQGPGYSHTPALVAEVAFAAPAHPGLAVERDRPGSSRRGEIAGSQVARAVVGLQVEQVVPPDRAWLMEVDWAWQLHAEVAVVEVLEWPASPYRRLSV